ncbi:MAG: Ig-like domain-containing protein, partial [Candidatus Thermoplasmatota archaeon]|nr:Ig-like domain-containing protein [Candidatus Thermoplasmatota archaeon]
GSHWMDVVDGTATFDCTQYPDGQYILTVKAVDLNGGMSASKISIYVDNTPPEIIPTGFPDMGQHVGGEVPFEMLVDDDGGMGTVRADVSGVIATLTVKPSTGVYLFTLDTTGILDGPLDVEFLAMDRAGNEASLTWTVHVDNTPPEIEVLAPGRDADGTIEFTVDITDSSTISEVELKIGDRPWVFMFRAADSTYRHQWDTGTRENGKDINFKVRATDEVGNTAEQVQKLDVTNPPYAYVGLAILMALVLISIYILYQRRGKEEEEVVISEDDEDVVASDHAEEATGDEEGEGPAKALADASDEEPSEVPDAGPTDGGPVEPVPELTGRPKTGTAGTRPPAEQEGWVESKDD